MRGCRGRCAAQVKSRRGKPAAIPGWQGAAGSCAGVQAKGSSGAMAALAHFHPSELAGSSVRRHYAVRASPLTEAHTGVAWCPPPFRRSDGYRAGYVTTAEWAGTASLPQPPVISTPAIWVNSNPDTPISPFSRVQFLTGKRRDSTQGRKIHRVSRPGFRHARTAARGPLQAGLARDWRLFYRTSGCSNGLVDGSVARWRITKHRLSTPSPAGSEDRQMVCSPIAGAFHSYGCRDTGQWRVAAQEDFEAASAAPPLPVASRSITPINVLHGTSAEIEARPSRGTVRLTSLEPIYMTSPAQPRRAAPFQLERVRRDCCECLGGLVAEDAGQAFGAGEARMQPALTGGAGTQRGDDQRRPERGASRLPA